MIRGLLVFCLVGLLVSFSLAMAHAESGDREAEIRAAIHGEDFAKVRTLLKSYPEGQDKERWQSYAAELEAAARAERAQGLIDQGRIDDADRLLKRALIDAQEFKVAALPKLRLLYEVVKARLANNHSRGADFLEELEKITKESDAAHATREAAIARDLAAIRLILGELEKIAAKAPDDAKHERVSAVEQAWKQINAESEKLIERMDALLGRMDTRAYLAEREALQTKLDAMGLGLAQVRARMHYFQRSWAAARNAAAAGLAIDARDRYLLDLISKVNRVTATKSLLERINKK